MLLVCLYTWEKYIITNSMDKAYLLGILPWLIVGEFIFSFSFT
jgi:DNA topoisomerase VI subunit B